MLSKSCAIFGGPPQPSAFSTKDFKGRGCGLYKLVLRKELTLLKTLLSVCTRRRSCS